MAVRKEEISRGANFNKNNSQGEKFRAVKVK
jgi:hypothetical protein